MTGYREPGLSREARSVWQTGDHEPDPFDTSFDAYDAQEAAEWDNLPYPRPQGDRCNDCGYRTDSAGHRTQCEDK